MSKQSARWVSSSDVIPMFPTLVWKVQLEPHLHRQIDAQVLSVLARLRGPLPPLAPGHGWQSIQTLHTLPVVAPRRSVWPRSARRPPERARHTGAGDSESLDRPRTGELRGIAWQKPRRTCL
jgi:hypothetical protein